MTTPTTTITINARTQKVRALPVTANQRQRHYRKTKRAANAGVAVDMENRRAVIYIRISKKRENETSTESQEMICRDYCARHGMEVIAVFVDTGESAFKDKAPRANFRKALNVIKAHGANTLVVYKLDRFMRDASTAVAVKEQIHMDGGSVVSATEGIDTGDRSNKTADLIFGILSWLAEMESITKSDRTRDWHNGRINNVDANGNPLPSLPPTGPRPFGYNRLQLAPKVSTLVIVEDEATIIRTAATRILAGEGLKGVAASLSTPERTISRTGLKHILTSETTAGLRFNGTAHLDGNWTGILDRATWTELAIILNEPGRHTGGPRGQRVHVLSGLMTCGKCDAVMRSRTHAKGPRYKCAKCNNAINAREAETAISDYLFANVDRDAWNAMRNAGRTFDPAVMEGFQKRLRTITAIYSAGDMDEDEYATGRAIIMEQIGKAEDSEPINLPAIDDVEAEWPTMDIDGKRLVINAAIRSITVDAWERGGEPRDRIRIMEN